MNLLFFQRGDYAKAYQAAQGGEPETYRNQYTTVNFVAGLAEHFSVTTLSTGDDPHDITLAPNLRSVRILRQRKKTDVINAALPELAPNIVVTRSPYLPVLRYTASRKIPTLPLLADIISVRPGLKGLRDRLHFQTLRRALLQPNIPCVGNHSRNASRSLVDVLGLPPSHVVPWDWRKIVPLPMAKTAASPQLSAFYAGMLSDAKGVGDILEAIALLKRQGLEVSLSLAGNGTLHMPTDVWKERVAEMGLEAQVRFLGLVPNNEIRERMAAHDLVLVTTRASYGEGFPNTIVEGLASRSPLIVSNHPAFNGRLLSGRDCQQFESGNPSSLAQAIRHLAETPELYADLSESAPAAIERLNFGVEWFQLIELFLKDPANRSGWVEENMLSQIDKG